MGKVLIIIQMILLIGVGCSSLGDTAVENPPFSDIDKSDETIRSKGSYTGSHWKDDFFTCNTNFWDKLENFTWNNNGSYMKSYNVENLNGFMAVSVQLRDVNGPFESPEGKRFHSCGQLFNKAMDSTGRYNFKYGKYVVRMKAVKGSGIISSFYLFRWDPWQEIDIEILGKDTSKIQINIFYNSAGNASVDSPETFPLGFDAAADFHEYAMEWEKDYISWFVDGKLLTKRDTTRYRIPEKPMYLSMNVWNSSSINWAGKLYTKSKAKVTAYYDWVEFFPSGTYKKNPM